MAVGGDAAGSARAAGRGPGWCEAGREDRGSRVRAVRVLVPGVRRARGRDRGIRASAPWGPEASFVRASGVGAGSRLLWGTLGSSGPWRGSRGSEGRDGEGRREALGEPPSVPRRGQGAPACAQAARPGRKQPGRPGSSVSARPGAQGPFGVTSRWGFPATRVP